MGINKSSHTEQKPQSADAAFTDLFNGCYARLCYYAYQYVRSKAEAEDIVQECFCKLWMRHQQIDFGNGAVAYLYSMVRNASYDHLKEKNKNGVTDMLLEDYENETVASNLIVTETLHEIYRIMETLPPRTRDVFQMLFVQGKDHPTAARELAITESTIRTQKARAITLIRRHLNSLLLAGLIIGLARIAA